MSFHKSASRRGNTLHDVFQVSASFHPGICKSTSVSQFDPVSMVIATTGMMVTGICR